MSDAPRDITFNRPAIVGDELRYVREAVDAMHTAGDGPFTRRCAAALRDALGATSVMLTPSCTDALELAALLLELEPGDEVIAPSFTFSSTVNAFVLRGARPVFVDARPDTLNIDESAIEQRIGDRTRAIVAMHYAGVGCEMDTIGALAERHGLTVVEDNAQGLFGTYRGRPLGSFAPLSCLSFHETKNLACGEGGALAINDPAYVARAEILRDKGTNRQQLFRGQVDKYTWVDVGSSFLMSDILAAWLWAQIEARERIQARRREVWERYDGGFRGELEAHGVRLPTVPDHCGQSYHLYWIMLPDGARRDGLIGHLRERSITAVFHYTPLHLSAMGRRLGGRPGDCPVTERAGECLLRMPFYFDLAADDQDRVIDAVRGFFAA